MNDENQVVRALLQDDSFEQLRRASLQQGLDCLRRKRRRIRLARMGVLTLAAIALPGWLLLSHWHELTVAKTQPLPSREPLRAQAETEATTIQQIGDAELLALFPGQNIALVGPPGAQHLLVFGPSPSSATMAQ